MATYKSSIILNAIGLLFSTTGLILHIVGVATPDWVVYSVDASSQLRPLFGSGHTGDDQVTGGIWQLCLGSDCIGLLGTNYEDRLRACQAFAIIGIILGTFACLFGGITLIKSLLKKDQKTSHYTAATLYSFSALGCIIIAVIIYRVFIYDKKVKNLGYSFIISVVGGVLIPVGGVLVCRATRVDPSRALIDN